MQRPSLWILIAVYLGASAAHGALVVYEGFNYSNGNNLIGTTSLGGDFGWGSGATWSDLRDPKANPPSEPTAFKITNSNKPTVAGLSGSTGQAATTNGSNSDYAEAWRTLSTTYSASNVSGTNKLWVSFVLRRDATVHADDYGVIQMGNLSIGASGNGKYSLENLSAGTATTTGPAVTSSTVIIIASIDFDTAGSTDTVKLYDSTNLSGGRPATGSPIASMNFDVGSISSVGLVFGWTGAAWTFDELRMANAAGSNTTEDAAGMALVTPMPEPSALGLPLFGAAALLRRRRLARLAAVEVH